jgi:broad specificity phosphatase PhoE
VDTAKRRAWYRDRFVPTLEPLLALETESVLVTHGTAIAGGGREALREALAADPWHYR